MKKIIKVISTNRKTLVKGLLAFGAFACLTIAGKAFSDKSNETDEDLEVDTNNEVGDNSEEE